MRWLAGSLAAVAVLLLTFPVLAQGSSDAPGRCTSALGIRTLGDSESCDTWGLLVSLPAALLTLVLVAWVWKRVLPGRGRDAAGVRS